MEIFLRIYGAESECYSLKVKGIKLSEKESTHALSISNELDEVNLFRYENRHKRMWNCVKLRNRSIRIIVSQKERRARL